jgi:chromosome partitioning protein
MLIAALCNQKGGVGKTTTTINLARAALLQGLPTLVVDLDPQANTTAALLGGFLDEATPSVAEVLSARSPVTIGEALVPTGWAGVDVLPCGGDTLADVAGELVTMGPGREHRLAEALHGLPDLPPPQPSRSGLQRSVTGYELVLIDCPPALDLLTINALTAAARLLVVTTAGLWSADGIARLVHTVDAVRRYTNLELDLAGILVNAWEDTRRQRHWLAELAENGPAPIWQPPIRKGSFIAEAVESGLGLDEWGTPAASVLAETYRQFLIALIKDETPS